MQVRKREKWEKGFIGRSGRDWYTAEGEKGLGRKVSKGIEVPERKVERKVRSFTGQLGDRQNIGWRTAGFARAGRERERKGRILKQVSCTNQMAVG